jgi:hypothetical protein
MRYLIKKMNMRLTFLIRHAKYLSTLYFSNKENGKQSYREDHNYEIVMIPDLK